MKNKKYSWLPYAVLAGVFGLLAFLNIFYLEHWLDSDMAAEMIFSKLLVEENHWIAAKEWYYSTEFRVLYTQLIMAPLLRIFDSWHVVRALTNMVFYVLLFISYCYMMKPLKVQRKWVVWTGVILLLPFSEAVMTHMQMGNTYMSHVILIFLAFGMFLRLSEGMTQKSQKISRFLLLGLYCILSIICGVSGVRYMLALYAPLVLTALWEQLQGAQWKKLREKPDMNNIRSFLAQKKTTRLWYSLLGAFMAVVGYAINVLIVAKQYTFQTYESIDFIAIYKGIFLERLQNTFGSLMQLLGYISNKSVLSLRGIITIIAFLFVAMGIYFTVRSRKLARQEEEGKLPSFMNSFFIMAFVVNTFVFLFTNSTIVDRYYITVLVFVLPLIALYFEKESIPLDRILAGGLLAGCLLLTTAKSAYSFINADKNADRQPVAAFLMENGYEFGYATYWNANIMTELTDGKIEVANIMADTSTEGSEPEFAYFKWSSPARYYTSEYEEKASFLLLTTEELLEFQDYEAVKNGEKVYEDAHYTVLKLGDKE